MNSEITIKQNIEKALNNFLDDQQPLREASTTFLNTLGYHSGLVGSDEIDKPRYDRIKETAKKTANPPERLCIEDWKPFSQILQVTDSEINAQLTDESPYFESKAIDTELRSSYMFISMPLAGDTYTRTQLSNITRFMGMRIPQSFMMIFRYSDVLTLAIINRRPNLSNTTKQVLEKVTLIKDINLDSSKRKRAHIDILSELHLRPLIKNKGVKNFDTLHNQWESILNTEPLNRKFYGELYNWYEWAVGENKVKFPTDEKRVLKKEEHVIRLITRLLFIWFIKEKGLVEDDLFNKEKIQNLLDEDDFDNGDSYYRVVLQNLFFATLNTEIDKREFSKQNYSGNRNFSRYRYKTQMNDPKKLLKLFEKTPFINGGLFDCLDTFEAPSSGGYRIDCFSDEDYHKLSIPNYLFFDENQGLIPLLEHYKFTVEEHTPIDQEVALDPELLGRAFEHLLAEYNPETRKNAASARKKTGSYYTPRAIVDYMVEEALVAALSQKCKPTNANEIPWDERLHYLFDYAKVCDDAGEWFDHTETDTIVKTISELKILDPAVGSGAFPMGMLQKLTLALRRLDPNNIRWEKLQRDLAGERARNTFASKDDQERPEELTEIDNIFKRYRDSDFGRKLYLIQNSIFGVDIQPIACQIAKLRFFVSLVIEQPANKNPNENYGIKPLPNLETRFVAANTLIGIKEQLRSQKAVKLELKLRDNREQYFHANTRKQKRDCKTEDKRLRAELATELKSLGMSAADAEKIAEWDLYDQNATADWFDKELMFGVTGGFDVVIGNPPYIKEYTYREAFDGLRESPYYQGKMDIWYMFACEGLDLVRNGKGLVTFIAQNNWVTSDGASKMRNKVIQDAQILSLVDFGSFKIFLSGIQTMIMAFRKNIATDNYPFDYRRLCSKDLTINDVMALLNKDQNNKTEYINPIIKRSKYTNTTLTFNHSAVELILDKISLKRDFLLRENEVAQGFVCPQDSVNNDSQNILGNDFNIGDGIFVLSQKEKDQISFTQQELDFINPCYTTQELNRYYANPINPKWVIYTDSSFKKDEKKIEDYPNIKKHLDKFQEVITSSNKPYGMHRARKQSIFQGDKIISVRKCARPTFTYVEFDSYVSQTFFLIKTKRINLKYLTGLLNSRLVTFWLKHKGKMQGINYQIDKQPLLSIPLISPIAEEQVSITSLVDQILNAKRVDPNADTSNLEDKIDKLVYALYDLIPEEIAIVEDAV